MKKSLFLLLIFICSRLGAQNPVGISVQYSPPVKFTAEQDHQNMMDQLGIKSLRSGPIGVSNDYKTEVMPPYNTSMLDGELAWRQHDGGHTASQLHFPSKIQIITKITIVPKQPPPNFKAPYPESSPLKRLFMIVIA